MIPKRFNFPRLFWRRNHISFETSICWVKTKAKDSSYDRFFFFYRREITLKIWKNEMNNQLIFIYLFLLFSRQIRVNLRKYLFCMTTASSREIKQKEKFLFKAREREPTERKVCEMGKSAKFEFSDSLYLSAMQFRSWDLRTPFIAFVWVNSIKSISKDRR